MRVDFGRTAGDYGRHRAGFPPALLDRLAAAGLARGRVLDIGTGTGTIARGLAARGAAVVGLDRAASMLARARELAAAEGGESLPNRVAARWVVADVHRLPCATESLDGVTAGQCWHWLDPAVAGAEIARVLRPGGRLALCSHDWLPSDEMVGATEALIRAHNPAWSMHGGDGRHPEYAADAARAGLEVVETGELLGAEPYTHADWRGRIRASAGVGASLAPEGVERFDAALAELLAARFPDPLAVPHRTTWTVARRP